MVRIILNYWLHIVRVVKKREERKDNEVDTLVELPKLYYGAVRLR